MMDFRPVDCATRQPFQSFLPGFINETIYGNRVESGWSYNVYGSDQNQLALPVGPHFLPQQHCCIRRVLLIILADWYTRNPSVLIQRECTDLPARRVLDMVRSWLFVASSRGSSCKKNDSLIASCRWMFSCRTFRLSAKLNGSFQRRELGLEVAMPPVLRLAAKEGSPLQQGMAQKQATSLLAGHPACPSPSAITVLPPQG